MTTVFVPNPPMTASEEISRAAMLVNAARLIPEPTVYGTSTCRVVVLGILSSTEMTDVLAWTRGIVTAQGGITV